MVGVVLDSQAVALIVSLGEGGMYFRVFLWVPFRDREDNSARSHDYRQQNQCDNSLV